MAVDTKAVLESENFISLRFLYLELLDNLVAFDATIITRERSQHQLWVDWVRSDHLNDIYEFIQINLKLTCPLILINEPILSVRNFRMLLSNSTSVKPM